ncbi:hypothetical protein KUTeg_012864 [Tegillarca granosa]|uniref:Uncharacterized protein n=1 Tax=Tegillarca granosa TaxID=220873 RepID=A0ABQ9EW66_TEGGR|nr:hypothetical protein KUTeg_012864 [Tegillarca granosa]
MTTIISLLTGMKKITVAVLHETSAMSYYIAWDNNYKEIVLKYITKCCYIKIHVLLEKSFHIDKVNWLVHQHLTSAVFELFAAIAQIDKRSEEIENKIMIMKSDLFRNFEFRTEKNVVKKQCTHNIGRAKIVKIRVHFTVIPYRIGTSVVFYEYLFLIVDVNEVYEKVHKKVKCLLSVPHESEVIIDEIKAIIVFIHLVFEFSGISSNAVVILSPMFFDVILDPQDLCTFFLVNAKFAELQFTTKLLEHEQQKTLFGFCHYSDSFGPKLDNMKEIIVKLFPDENF